MQHTAEAIAKANGINKTQVNLWRNVIRDNAPTLFIKGKIDLIDNRQSIIEEQQAVIGQLTLENMQLKKIATIPMKQRLALLDCNHHTLSIATQCKLYVINRSTVYYKPTGESRENLDIMRILDEQYMQTPFFGVKHLRRTLAELGYRVNVKRIRRLMQLVGWKTVYCKPRTTRPDPIALKYPYLLTGLKVTEPNQVWSIDITYVPMKDSFAYLCAIIDIYYRLIVGWGINNQMSAEWCADIVEDAVGHYGSPQIINSDQGSQFTSDVYIAAAKRHGIRISMDGKGRALDNIFIERLWRTVKHEHLYIYKYVHGSQPAKGFAPVLFVLQ